MDPNSTWSCGSCRTSNAGRRDRCFKCKRARPALQALVAALATGGGAAAPQTTSELAIVPPAESGGAWTEALDFSTRQIYYFNTATGETSWARPAELGPTPFASGWFGRGSVSGGDQNMTLVQNNLRWLARPARKQADLDISKLQRAEGSNELNIWYGRYTGDLWRGGLGKDPAPTRCHPERDAGWTKATLASDKTSFCLHFARGGCAKGAECAFHHRVPTAEDDATTDSSRDIFGRDRHASHRSDMGGIGSMMKDCRTLYVGGLRRPPSFPADAALEVAAPIASARGGRTGQGGGAGVGASAGRDVPSGPPVPNGLVAAWENLVRSQFEVWGEIESVNVIVRLAVAFVRFRCRVNAEYALMSMANQSLGNGEVLNVRWAYDDPNPAAIAAREAADAAAITASLAARGIRILPAAGPAERPAAPAPPPPPISILQDADGALGDRAPAPLPVVVPSSATAVDGEPAVTVSAEVPMEASPEAILTFKNGATLISHPVPAPLASYVSWGGRAGGGGVKRARENE